MAVFRMMPCISIMFMLCFPAAFMVAFGLDALEVPRQILAHDFRRLSHCQVIRRIFFTLRAITKSIEI
jgi:hypothetical protein